MGLRRVDVGFGDDGWEGGKEGRKLLGVDRICNRALALVAAGD